MENNKKIIITVLSVLVVAMAVGYALLAQELTINGTASIDSTWKVEITNITQKEINGGVTEKSKSYTATTANFDIGFTQPGDYVIYDIEVTNSGTLDAIISNINVVTDNNPAIIYTTSGLKRGDKILKNNGTNTLTIKVDYDSSVTSQPASTTNNITVTINYGQDLGQVPAYEAYSIGDTVEFAGSNWRVIKNSTGNDDYVTLMKETVLTNAELGNYAFNGTSDTMSYYWDDSCHPAAYGYSSSIYNCDNTNSYETSKIKEFLEGTYINTLNSDNLKEIDDYKIRLINMNELTNSFGYTVDNAATSYYLNPENTPAWVYSGFGEGQNSVSGYWTMEASALDNNNSRAWLVNSNGYTLVRGSAYTNPINGAYGIRPVINLLKSSIS